MKKTWHCTFKLSKADVKIVSLQYKDGSRENFMTKVDQAFSTKLHGKMIHEKTWHCTFKLSKADVKIVSLQCKDGSREIL
jgi:hypothetical protein